MRNDRTLGRVLLKKVDDALNNLFLQNSFLNLGKLENDWNETSKVSFRVDTDTFAILKTVEGNVNNVLIQK